jgi:Pyridoxamine 5'-phosphate oxidase
MLKQLVKFSRIKIRFSQVTFPMLFRDVRPALEEQGTADENAERNFYVRKLRFFCVFYKWGNEIICERANFYPRIVNIDPRFSDPDTVATGWDETRRALEEAELFWISTVRSNGRPHVTPLVAVWLDMAIYFSTGPTEQKAMNLRGSPHVILTTGLQPLGRRARRRGRGGRCPGHRRYHARTPRRGLGHEVGRTMGAQRRLSPRK